MTRPLDAATANAVVKPILPLAAIVYLDVEGDPLFAWSGIGDLPFAPGQTGDPSLDGKTFYGTGSIIEISAASDGVGGSDTLEVSLPGIDMTLAMARSVISFRNRWQFRRAVVWLMALDPVTDLIAGKPFRIKTGRMDQMPYNDGRIKCRIEGQQAYGNVPLGTRYTEQPDINPNDISQKYAHSLANMTASLGQASAQPGMGATGAGSSSFTGVVNGAKFADGGYLNDNLSSVD